MTVRSFCFGVMINTSLATQWIQQLPNSVSLQFFMTHVGFQGRDVVKGELVSSTPQKESN
jgi:hypothetical protein